MGLISGLIGGAVSAISSINGHKRMKKLAAENNAILNKQASDNEAWYNRRYNEDALQQADAQRALTAVADSVRRRNQQAAGTSAVMGGTGAAEAAARAQNNEAVSQTASGIAANAAARKNSIEQQYMANKQNIANQRIGMNNQQMGQIAKSTEQMGQLGGLITASNVGGDWLERKLEKIFKKKDKE